MKIIINLLDLLLLLTSILAQANAFSIKFTAIDSPQSQILPQELTTKERTQLRVNISVSRALYANKRNAKVSLNSIGSKLYYVPGFYVTQVFIGSDKGTYNRYLVLDLYSDQTWFQCAGCDPCFNITDGNKRVEDSPSYVRMTFEDKLCVPQLNYEGSCGFNYTFGPGHVEGYLGTDTFTFLNAQGISQYFPNLAFGCGMHNTGIAWESDNTIAGIFGLSSGPRSFLVQLTKQIKDRFAYCVPVWGEAKSPTSTIAFGDDAQISGDLGRTVQTIVMNAQARYHLYLNAITLNGSRLPIDPSVWKLDNTDYSSVFFMDPSAPFTVLAQTPYFVLKDAVVAYFSQYGIEPTPPSEGLDLCFPTIPDSFPRLSFNFLKSLDDSGEVDLFWMCRLPSYYTTTVPDFVWQYSQSRILGLVFLGHPSSPTSSFFLRLMLAYYPLSLNIVRRILRGQFGLRE